MNSFEEDDRRRLIFCINNLSVGYVKSIIRLYNSNFEVTSFNDIHVTQFSNTCSIWCQNELSALIAIDAEFNKAKNHQKKRLRKINRKRNV
ncbi:CLUMA_CG003698, isoform A [Clunio marinus]|uniref:CLUMA_CG003698, isoform A n=1 Tax=Clunio marinus TaxID=568069 RepID=A0A1J1HR03_9DIPT|nr:CLUMA_CG003698, isoform A [Clunio marinus]